MNKIKKILLYLVLATNIVAQTNINLDDCFNILFEKSPHYKNLELQYERIEANRELSLVYKYPTINLKMGVPFSLSQSVQDVFNSELDQYTLILNNSNRFAPVLTLNSDYQLPTGGNVGVSLSTYYNTFNSNYTNDREDLKYSFFANFSQPLFRVNNYRVSAEIKENEYRKTKLRFFESKNELMLNTIEKYYAALLNQKITRMEKENLESKMAQFEFNKLQYKLGKFSEIDLVSAKLSIKTQELELAQAEEKLNIIKNELILFLGMGMNVSIDLDETVEFLEIDIPLEDALNIVVKNNPNYKALEYDFIIGNLNQEIKTESRVKTEFTASTLFSNQTYYLPQNYQTNLYDYKVGLGISIPILDGGKGEGEIELSRIQLLEIKIKLIEEKKSLELKISEYYNLFSYYKNQYSILEAKLELSKSSYDIYKNEYSLGRITLFELNEYENEIYKAEKFLIESVINYNKKVLELKTILGMEIF